jgi:hypothetical protein
MNHQHKKLLFRKSAKASVASTPSNELWRKSAERQAINGGAKGYARTSPRSVTTASTPCQFSSPFAE